MIHLRTHSRRTALIMAASLGLSLGGVLPQANAAAIPVVQHVTLSTSGSNSPGSTVTLTAHGQASGGSLLYDFWVQEPNGHWKQVQPWSSHATYTMPHIQHGSYLVVVNTLTSAQFRAGDWKAIKTAEQTVNVGTSVTVSHITHALASSGVTAGKPVTITAQAQNITHPVYQFWTEQHGQWTGSNYTSHATYTFTPKTTHFKVAVYAKTKQEPNNAGSGLGLTPSTATTPHMLAMHTASTQAQHTLLSILHGYSFWKNNNGVSTRQLVGAPKSSVIDPLIPSSLPANGTIQGAASLVKADPSLVSQAQAIAKSHSVTVSASVLEAGMHKAAQIMMTYEGNDPAKLMSLMSPGLLVPNYKGGAVQAAVQNLLKPYQGGYSIQATHNYVYDQSVHLQTSSTYPQVSVQSVTHQAPGNVPARILDMTVPMTLTEVMNYQASGHANNVSVMTMRGNVTVTLFRDPLVPGGLQWGMSGINTKAIKSPIIWHAS